MKKPISFLATKKGDIQHHDIELYCHENCGRKNVIVCALLTVVLFFSSVSGRAQCLNLDFSMANFTYWQPYIGTWYWSSANIDTSAVTANRHVIMDAAQLTLANKMQDENCNLINKVPAGFKYSAKLGNSSVNAQMEALEYTLNVDSTNSLLILHFAWVMEVPSHSPAEQPRFSMKIRDTLGNLIQGISCGDVNFIASLSLPNLACNTTNLVARNWTTVGFSLGALIGRKVKIYFETRDCSQGGHYGYAYMVGECRPMAIDVMYCEGQDTAYLSAPDGFMEYKWTRSTQPAWLEQGSGASYQNIVVNDPVNGEEFMCELSSEIDPACSSTLRAVILRTSVNADFRYGIMENGNVDIVGHDSTNWYDTCSRTATFVSLSSAKNNTIESVTWEIPNLNVFSADSLFTHTFPASDTAVNYLIRLTVATKNGCMDTMEQYIMIEPMPAIDSIGNIIPCSGENQSILFTGTNMNPDSCTWVNSNPVIGLDSCGKGNILFTTVNRENTPLTANITATPVDNRGCTGN
ncbi:MAG: hypothetical protein LBI60_06935, partial [Bacteroidales bacterium]|nr:hypothetical protein [Bacteroidales bacterium]